MSADDSTKRCSRCGEYWPATPRHFYRTSGGKCAAHGLYSICKACMAYPENRARIRAEMRAPDGHRVCGVCLEIYPAMPKYFKHHSEGRLRRKCRACEVGPKRRPHERAKMIAPDGMAPCYTCMEVKPHTTEFFRTSPKGYPEYQCVSCLRAASAASSRKNYRKNHAQALGRDQAWRAANLDRTAAATRRYRANNPERVKALRYARRAAPGKHTGQDLRDMYDSQQGLCAYCVSPMFDKWTVDHMVPLSRGGSNNSDNLALVCGSCNSRKHDKTTVEYFEWLRVVS